MTSVSCVACANHRTPITNNTMAQSSIPNIVDMPYVQMSKSTQHHMKYTPVNTMQSLLPYVWRYDKSDYNPFFLLLKANIFTMVINTFALGSMHSI